MKKIPDEIYGLLLCFLCLGYQYPLEALPPEDDIPEEILSQEIIIQGQSPINNEFLSAEEYQLLRREEKTSQFSPIVDSSIRHQVFFLNILHFINTINIFR